MNEVKVEKLKVGMVITVTEWEPYGNGNKDRSYVGDVLKIEAIDLPFIVTSSPNDGWKDWPTTLDTRMVHLKELSKAFIKATERKKDGVKK